jgi:hypothetical protein
MGNDTGSPATSIRHSRESGNPVSLLTSIHRAKSESRWVDQLTLLKSASAFAGMTSLFFVERA